ncbi:PIN-like domain-containing protein [Streptomyces sp. NY05-11A]|uniref:PIN-like domain-containing protein n=1 Tax=Streptomyces soliscabiei TaxID=588897 RepID=UPI0029A33A94|nr:PIN-like domain-containing protein [Streptomyces sp. NY05-11A]MDX2682446.1 hypothetical protein [Streptomyces sp. NY05-11A]
MVEFWRNRESTLSDARSSGAQAAEDMAGHAAQAERTLRTWANRVALPEEETERLRSQLNEVFDDVQETIVEVGDGQWQNITQDTSTGLVAQGAGLQPRSPAGTDRGTEDPRWRPALHAQPQTVPGTGAA